MSKTIKIVVRYSLPIVAVAAGLAIRLLITTWIGPGLPTYITFYPAVLVTALLAGFGPGVLATLCSTFVVLYWVVPPAGIYTIESTIDFVGILLFTSFGIFMCFVIESYRRIQRKATEEIRAANERLEDRIKERTTELENSNNDLQTARNATLNLLEEMKLSGEKIEKINAELQKEINERKLFQEQLEDERDFINAVLQTSGALITVIDTSGRITRFNRACEELTGYTFDEVKGRTVFEFFIPPEERADVIGIATRLFEGEKRVDHENHWVTKSGEKRYLRWRNSILLDDKGAPAYAVATGIDITDRKRAEEALRQSEKRFRTMADAIPQLAWIAHDDGYIFWYNKRWYDYTGKTPEEMEGWGWENVHDPQILPSVLEQWKESIATGEPFNMEFPLRGSDGIFHQFLTRVMPLKDLEGRVVQWFGTNTNIDELKGAEKKIRESEKRYRSIFNNLPMGIVEVDTKDTIIFANDHIRKILGYTLSELQSMKISQLTVPESRIESEDVSARIHRGEINRIAYEKKYLKKDGSSLWVNVTVSGLYDNDHHFRGALGAVEDISERKKEEEARAQLSAIVEHSSNAIIGKTLDGIITSWNIGAMKIYGYTEEEVRGKSISILIPPEYIDDTKEILQNIKAGKPVVNRETVRQKKNGTIFPVLLTISPVRDTKGNIVAASTIAYDISERKRLEEQLEQRAHDLEITNKELESFSYSVAHDLRNPLKAISGFASFLIEDCNEKLNDDCRDYMSRIVESTKRMNSIIDDILALSKISRQDMEIKTIDMSSMAQITIRELLSINPTRNVKVTIQEGMEVNADARLMSVALGNLLGNAWKYTGKTEDSTIEFGFFTKKDKKIYFIKDNGAGFDMSQADKLFAPFKRLHSDKEFKGTGVGLAIVERAITRHGGKIWAEGEPGKGATFYFTLGG